MTEHRKFSRLGTIWKLEYRTIAAEELNKDALKGFTLNISGGGICFEADNEISNGTLLALELKSKVFPSSIIALGKTVWCKKEDARDKYEVGVEFWWTGWDNQDAQFAMADYISKQTKKEK